MSTLPRNFASLDVHRVAGKIREGEIELLDPGAHGGELVGIGQRGRRVALAASISRDRQDPTNSRRPGCRPRQPWPCTERHARRRRWTDTAHRRAPGRRESDDRRYRSGTVPVTTSCDWLNSPTAVSDAPPSSMKVTAHRPDNVGAVAGRVCERIDSSHPGSRAAGCAGSCRPACPGITSPLQFIAHRIGGEAILVTRHGDFQMRTGDRHLARAAAAPGR